MEIPESISALSKKHGPLWTLCIWVITFLGMCAMVPYNDTYSIVAFLSCSCLGFVGIMPLIEGQHNTVHNILGIGACLLSQLWCGLVGGGYPLIIWWVLYVILLPFFKSKWCFFAEIWCLISIISIRFLL